MITLNRIGALIKDDPYKWQTEIRFLEALLTNERKDTPEYEKAIEFKKQELINEHGNQQINLITEQLNLFKLERLIELMQGKETSMAEVIIK